MLFSRLSVCSSIYDITFFPKKQLLRSGQECVCVCVEWVHGEGVEES